MTLCFATTPTFTVPTVPALSNEPLRRALQAKLDNKTKPIGSLGKLETLAWQLGSILGTETPILEAPQMLVCAADHGLAARGVSAYPSDVTWQMVENFLAGGAAVSVLARQHDIALTVVDCGVRHDFLQGTSSRPGLQVRKTALGTADSLEQPAMSIDQCQAALQHGAELVALLPGNILLLGEMGIGNTSAASLLLAALTDMDIEWCTGAGTGLDAAGIARKTEVLRNVLYRHGLAGDGSAHSSAENASRSAPDPLAVLAAVGGFEIATLTGAVLAAAADNRVIVVDGFITGAAVLVAARLQPAVLQRCVFAHRSAERAHERMLTVLGAVPLLDLGLRLGEGSGAALAFPLLQSACRILAEMASFASAGVSQATGASDIAESPAVSETAE